MATVTHGGTLPNSSDKDDFYAIIDTGTVTGIIDSDIASGAAISDSKLATIATAGKVNVTALTGQIANSNLAQITTAAKVSGAALTLLGNIPSNAGIVPLANLPLNNLLGTKVSKTVTTVYQATTAGFVIATNISNGPSLFEVRSDSGNPPSTVVGKHSDSGDDADDSAGSICAPVMKDNYYTVVALGGASPNVYWIPLGA